MIAKVSEWIRGNLLFLAIAGLVIGSVIGAGSLILSVAAREGPLREAEVGLAELGTLAGALSMHPQNVVDRGGAAKSDLAVNKTIRSAATRAAPPSALHLRGDRPVN